MLESRTQGSRQWRCNCAVVYQSAVAHRPWLQVTYAYTSNAKARLRVAHTPQTAMQQQDLGPFAAHATSTS